MPRDEMILETCSAGRSSRCNSGFMGKPSQSTPAARSIFASAWLRTPAIWTIPPTFPLSAPFAPGNGELEPRRLTGTGIGVEIALHKGDPVLPVDVQQG